MSNACPLHEEGPQRKVRSLGHNLAVLHIISILIGFAICAVLLYLKLIEHLDDSAYEQLQTEITSVRALLHSPDGIKVIEEVIRAEGRGEEKRPSPILMRIVDREGKGIAASPRMAFLPSPVFPPAGDTRIKKFSARNTNYLLRNARLADPLSLAHGWRLEIAMDLSEHDHLASGYRSYLFFFAFGAFLFAIPSSYVVARRALKPLNDLSGSIKCITHSRLNTRLDLSRFPREMQSVVESVNGMMARLDDAFQRMSHYSGNLAHELRTPINNLMLEAEITLSQVRNPQEYQDIIASSLAEYERLAAIIDRLLFLARADSDNNDLMFEKLDAKAEVDEVVDYFSDEATFAGISLLSRGDGVFWADRTLFRRALSNLVSNALRHTPRGGEVMVSSSGVGAGPVDVTVTDTGCGIYSEHLPFLFDRFYRAKSGGSCTGTGLGLAIVKAIMEMHGGDVSVQSRPGHGTAVTLHFQQHPSLNDCGSGEP